MSEFDIFSNCVIRLNGNNEEDISPRIESIAFDDSTNRFNIRFQSSSKIYSYDRMPLESAR